MKLEICNHYFDKSKIRSVMSLFTALLNAK